MFTGSWCNCIVYKMLRIRDPRIEGMGSVVVIDISFGVVAPVLQYRTKPNGLKYIWFGFLNQIVCFCIASGFKTENALFRPADGIVPNQATMPTLFAGSWLSEVFPVSCEPRINATSFSFPILAAAWMDKTPFRGRV